MWSPRVCTIGCIDWSIDWLYPKKKKNKTKNNFPKKIKIAVDFIRYTKSAVFQL